MSNTIARPFSDYFPYGLSVAVRNCQFAADIHNNTNTYEAVFGAPLALSANGILAAYQNVANTAGTINAFTPGAGTATQIGYNGMVPFSSTTKRDGWGRNITVVASAVCARVVTITGYDYLGQKMQEQITLNGVTTVQGKKAFAWVSQFDIDGSGADVATVNVGYGNVLGLPYAGEAMFAEVKNGAVAANAGTFTSALIEATASTAITADTRGTYLPATVIPDGVQTFIVHYTLRRNNLHGNAQFTT